MADKKTKPIITIDKPLDPFVSSLFSYIGPLVLITLAFKPTDVNAKYHMKQGLALFIAEMITMAIGLFPILGWIFAAVMSWVWLVISLYGIYNVLMGRRRRLPIVGKYSDKINV